MRRHVRPPQLPAAITTTTIAATSSMIPPSRQQSRGLSPLPLLLLQLSLLSSITAGVTSSRHQRSFWLSPLLLLPLQLSLLPTIAAGVAIAVAAAALLACYALRNHHRCSDHRCRCCPSWLLAVTAWLLPLLLLCLTTAAAVAAATHDSRVFAWPVGRFAFR